jgi:hypothetical protein
MCLQVPRELRDQLASELRGSGIPVPESEERWELAMQALKGVWASKYNDRCATAYEPAVSCSSTYDGQGSMRNIFWQL